MRHYALKRGLLENHFEGRVDWWGHYPFEYHGQRMWEQISVCFALPATGHTGVNLALCAGVPVDPW